MKFDLAIGNPPYQEERKGESATALPLYDKFIDNATQIADAVELITPARFLFRNGRASKGWNEKMLNDEHFKVLMYEKDASVIFSGTDIKGGVAIIYIDQNKIFKPVKIFSPYPEMIAVLDKIKRTPDLKTMDSLGFVATKFNTTALCADYPELTGRERRMSSNVLEYEFFKKEKSSGDDILIYGVIKGKRAKRYLDSKYVDKRDINIKKYKVITPKADGSGAFGDALTNPEILPPDSGFTHTFLGIGGFAKESRAKAALKYIKTKFFRSLLSIAKATQNLNSEKLRFIPIQDFTPDSDIDWTQSIPEIDRRLYAKYGLDEEEIEFIESKVKPMA